jgi:hypothetical protein
MAMFRKIANALLISAVVFIALWLFIGLEFSSAVAASFIAPFGFILLFILVMFELS